ncbi:MAG: Winged helix-turn-helix transcription repressor,HrcA DNA-binding [Candidatus Argoarchaeum ethanivorans]|uniref:Winged helix-turn-helix transcription repressor,HrcA DNA-binding n=1 Tax=Candidatus Argoarchaeum ethanivorans TaxID=2608793 RepID=A0A811TBI9_9EURY|nr:MAG: Winged helix-turn-helix transcription repressor,HrcA DNA-binding [Candidatus Argoarchaeum ethanivorans]
MKLTHVQLKMLQHLIRIYHIQNDVVRAEDIAEKINRNSGTVRNQMAILKSLHLVRSVAGSRGGYLPTEAAYQHLHTTNKKSNTRVYKNGKKVEDVGVEDILLNTTKPLCSIIRLSGNTHEFNIGDTITVYPILFKQILDATVIGRDDTRSSIITKLTNSENRELTNNNLPTPSLMY